MPHLVLHHPLLTPCLSRLPSSSSSSSFPIRTQKSTAWIPQINHAGLLRWHPTTTIKCMANPRRVAMVAKQIRRELSDMFLTDNVLQHAILPEVALGADRYLSSLTTISDVEVSTDLQVVKVYVSVFGDERKGGCPCRAKVKSKYVRSELGKRMKLRLTPEIRFIEDESLERGSRVIAILDKIKNEKKDPDIQDEEQLESSEAPQDDTEWLGDDPDANSYHNANLDRRNSWQLERSFELRTSAMSHIVKLPQIFLCFSSGVLVICFLFWLVVTPEVGPMLFNG